MLLSSCNFRTNRCTDSRAFLEGADEVLTVRLSLRLFWKKFYKGSVQKIIGALMGYAKISIAKAVLYLGT